MNEQQTKFVVAVFIHRSLNEADLAVMADDFQLAKRAVALERLVKLGLSLHWNAVRFYNDFTNA